MVQMEIYSSEISTLDLFYQEVPFFKSYSQKSWLYNLIFIGLALFNLIFIGLLPALLCVVALFLVARIPDIFVKMNRGRFSNRFGVKATLIFKEHCVLVNDLELELNPRTIPRMNRDFIEIKACGNILIHVKSDKFSTDEWRWIQDFYSKYMR